jgi:hypothetical protein
MAGDGLTFTAAGSARDGGPAKGRTDVDVVNADVDNVELYTSSGVDVTGQIVFEDGAQLRTTIVLDDAEDLFGYAATANGPRDRRATTDEAGSFAFKNLSPGIYFLGATASLSSYVKALNGSLIDASNPPILDLTSVSSGTFQILLSSRTAAVSGMLQPTDHAPAREYWVSAWPAQVRVFSPAHVRTVRSTVDGRFSIEGLAPGRYHVAAWERIEPDVTLDGRFLAYFESEAPVVSLAENSREALDLTVVSAQRVASAISEVQ